MQDQDETPTITPVDESHDEIGDEKVAEITITTRKDWIGAGIISLVAFVLYFLTSSHWAFPGESSHLLALLTGARPNTMSDHFVWRTLLGLVTRVFGNGLAVGAATTICTLFSALSLGGVYLVSTAVFAILIDKDQLKKKHISDEFHADIAARLAGVVTTATLAFSAPFWVAATRVNFYSIYLLWTLGAAYLMLRFMAAGNVNWLYLFWVIYGMGMSQSSIMIQFSPVFLMMGLMGMIRADKMNPQTFIICLVLATAGWLMLFFISLYEFAGSRGYTLLEYWGESQLAQNLLKSLLTSVINGLPRTGWLILVGLVIFPWVAWLIVAFRTLNGESGPAVNGLNLAIFIVTMAVVLDTRVSPWQFFGFSSEQVITYTMAAMTFGYCVTAAYMYTVHLLSSKTESKLALVSARVLRVTILSLTAIVLVYETTCSSVHAETKNTHFMFTYVDRLISNLEGRSWVVTDGVFDDMMLLRAAELGVELNVVDLTSAGDPLYMKMLKEKLSSARLRNSVDIGAMTFLQEWISSDPDVTKKLALCLFPDLWNIGDYRIYPRGLTFFGGSGDAQDSSSRVADQENIDAYFKLMKTLDTELNKVSSKSAPIVLALADSVRRRVSFIGNNLGYFIETRGRKQEALSIYERVHAFDPKNVSAMLNYASLLAKFGTQEQQDHIKAQIAEFRKTQKKPLQIWELSRTQGYVNSPEAFSYLGWTWALSGNSTLAIKTLSMALGNDYDFGVPGIMMTMADIHSRRGDDAQTESILEAVLKQNPEDIKTLLGLAHLKMMKGNTAEAQALLERAAKTGVPKVRILREQASLKLSAGDIEGARTALYDLLVEAPKDADARFTLYMTFARDFMKAKDEKAKADIRANMVLQINEILDIPEARYFQGSLARGHMRLIENDLEGAREDFLVADKTMPGIVPILELILRIDYSLKDPQRAKEHAMEILKISSENPFANYIMGSIAMSHGEYASADAYLQKSIEKDANVLATGDLAYVKFKLDDLDRAFKLVTQALDRTKDLYEVWDTYGQILLEQGKLDEAESALRTALKLNVQNPIVHLHLAKVLSDQGRKQDSKNILEQIQPFETSLYGDERRYYEALWLQVYGFEKKINVKKN